MRSYMHVMIKPASSLCNMCCGYCFYVDEANKRKVKSFGMMEYGTLRIVLEKALAECRIQLTLAFQGGEPTLAGLEFFQRVICLVGELNVNHCKVIYTLQTNGLLIDIDWCRFLKENHFLVGVSLDGYKELHDMYRVDSEGKSTYSRVVHTLQLLEKHKVEFNILTVVTPALSRNIRRVYNFYSRRGWVYQQYIPCLDPFGEMHGQHPWSLHPQRFEEYLKNVFDCWYLDAVWGKKKYHRYFDNLLLIINNQEPEACDMRGVCGLQYVVEADGSVYPCDFYMIDQYKIGNFNINSIEEIDQKRKDISFCENSMLFLKECMSCKWGWLCRGGCRRNRIYYGDGTTQNYYCKSYQAFFEYAVPRLLEVYQLLVH